jgi:hypothetical protein
VHARLPADIAKGVAGYVDVARGYFQDQGGGEYLTKGTEKTCVQDSFYVCARWEARKLGHDKCKVASKTKVNADLAHLKDEEMEIATAICYFREKVGRPTRPVTYARSTDLHGQRVHAVGSRHQVPHRRAGVAGEQEGRRRVQHLAVYRTINRRRAARTPAGRQG